MRLLTTFYSTPWALLPEVFQAAEHIMLRWAEGGKLNDEQIAAAIGDAPEAAAARQAGAAAEAGRGVAVIPVYGVLTHRAYAASNLSRPLTSTENLSRQFKTAAADPSIGTIIADIDSPGGSVFGVQELAETLSSIRSSGKQLVAVANSTAASGAYWLAAQANEIVVTPSGMVGSIGVIVPHTDLSGAYEKAGVKRTYVTYGKYKAEGNETGPLDADAMAYMQDMVDGYGAAFTRAVARGRGVPVETVRGEAFGQGRMRLASDAVAHGMADRIDTLENTIARYARQSRGRSVARAMRDIQIAES